MTDLVQLSQELYDKYPITVVQLRQALSELRADDQLIKLAMTGNLGIIRDEQQIGYVDLLWGAIEMFDRQSDGA